MKFKEIKLNFVFKSASKANLKSDAHAQAP